MIDNSCWVIWPLVVIFCLFQTHYLIIKYLYFNFKFRESPQHSLSPGPLETAQLSQQRLPVTWPPCPSCPITSLMWLYLCMYNPNITQQHHHNWRETPTKEQLYSKCFLNSSGAPSTGRAQSWKERAHFSLLFLWLRFRGEGNQGRRMKNALFSTVESKRAREHLLQLLCCHQAVWPKASPCNVLIS